MEDYAAAECALRTLTETRALLDAMNAQLEQHRLRSMIAELCESPTGH